MQYTYKRLPRREVIRDPMIAAARKKLADAYRARRKENPALARLLFLRLRDASNQIVADAVKNGW